MVPPIPTVHREQILKLRNAGHSFRDIRDILIREHSITYSVIGIGNCYSKIMKNGGQLESQPKQKYSKEMLEKIKSELQNILESNNYLTGQQQIEQIKQRLGITISMDAVGRYRRLLGWRVLPTDESQTTTTTTTTTTESVSSSLKQKKPVRVSDIAPSSVATLSGGSGGGSCGSSTSSYSDETSSYPGNIHQNGGIFQPNILPPIRMPVPNHYTLPVPLGHIQQALVVPISQLERGMGGQELFAGQPQYQSYTDVVSTTTTCYPDNINFMIVDEPRVERMGMTIPKVESISEVNGALHGGQAPHPLVPSISEQQQYHHQQLSSVDSPSHHSSISVSLGPQSPAQFGPQHVFTSKSFIKSSTIPSLKYQVWAGISHMGATSICIWDADCRVKSSFYCDTILSRFFLPFRAERYANRPDIARAVQNNDTIYRSNEARQFMIENGIEVETWTYTKFGGVNNPIELVWDDINSHIRSEVKPTTLDALRAAICDFWATKMTDSRCRNYLKGCSIYAEPS